MRGGAENSIGAGEGASSATSARSVPCRKRRERQREREREQGTAPGKAVKRVGCRENLGRCVGAVAEPPRAAATPEEALAKGLVGLGVAEGRVLAGEPPPVPEAGPVQKGLADAQQPVRAQGPQQPAVPPLFGPVMKVPCCNVVIVGAKFCARGGVHQWGGGNCGEGQRGGKAPVKCHRRDLSTHCGGVGSGGGGGVGGGGGGGGEGGGGGGGST